MRYLPKLVFSRGVGNTCVIPEYFNIIRGEYEFSVVTIHIRGKVRGPINISIKGNMSIVINNKIGYILFKSYIFSLSSFQKLSVTSRILGELE